ncbi:uncharacterized protein LOC143020689 [Oratosquilla oratoria]|uniref:uncharacterized protein LOC143020689 n=1 Tax=Oratosquilla oratoria TaxID=337810 RepID=UPI003F762C3F
MKLNIKILQGGGECSVELPPEAKVSELKEKVSVHLNVDPSVQRLVIKGKTLSDDASLVESNLSDGARLHLVVKKTDASAGGSGFTTKAPPCSTPDYQTDLFVKLEIILKKHLTPEQSAKTVSEFKKNCQALIDGMNFEDMERFAASNFTEF